MKRRITAYLIVFLSISAYSLSALAASEGGDDFARGSANFKAKKYRSAYKLLKPFAEEGNPEAQVYLGRMYASGRLAELDGAEAAHWFRKAADQGNPEAQYSLGQLYLSGWGVPANAKTALAWLWKAGRQDYLKAQLLLGRLLSEGKRVPQDLGAARLWYAQAATQGSVEAAEKLKAMGGVSGPSDGAAGLSASGKAPVLPDVVETSAGDRNREELMRRRLAELRTVYHKEKETLGAAMGEVTEPFGDDEASDADSEETLVLDEGEAGIEKAAAKEEVVADEAVEEQVSDEGEGLEELVLDDGEGVEELVLEEFDGSTSVDDSGVDAGSDDSIAVDGSDDFVLLDDEPSEQEPVVREAKAGRTVTSAEVTETPEPVGAVPEPVKKAAVVAAVAAPVVVEAAKKTAEPPGKPAAAPVAVVPPEQPESVPAKAKVDALGLYGREWVLARQPNHYTIQLLGTRTRAEVERFVKKNTLTTSAAVVESSRRRKPWFSLFYGDYRNYSQAKSALKKLSKGLAKHSPWIRKFKKLQ